MKKLKFLMLLGLPMLFGEAYGQKYQSPQWEMPLVFIDGSGASDTIWFGYDPQATEPPYVIDSQFDEGWKWIDTTKFHAYLFQKIPNWGTGLPNCPIHSDSVRKRDIINPEFIIYSQVGFTKGISPITIKWVDELLDSEKLPEKQYPPLTPRPRAKIDMWISGGPQEPSICFDAPRSFTNYITDDIICPVPTRDSMTIYTIGGSCLPFCEFSFTLTSHNFNEYGSVVNTEKADVSLHPNPAKNYIVLELSYSEISKIKIVDLSGKQIMVMFSNEKNVELNISHLEKGIYILQIEQKNKLYFKKIIKL